MKNQAEIYFSNKSTIDDLKIKAIQGASATVLSRISIYIFQLAGTIILARLVSPSDFGLVAMVTVFTNILVEFGILRLSDATIQKETISHSQISTLFWINTILCIFLSIILAISSPLIAWFYDDSRLIQITIAISVAFIFSGMSNQHLALLQRNMEFGKYSIVQVLSVIIADAMAIIMALYSYGYWAIVVRRIGMPFITFLGAITFCRWWPGPPKYDSDVKSMLKFGLGSFGNYGMNYITRSLDKVLIGQKLGAQWLGFYDKAYYLFVMPVNQLSYPLTSVAISSLGKISNEVEKFKKYYINAVSIIAFIGIYLSLFLTISGKDIIIFILGPQWRSAGEIFTAFAPSVWAILVYGTNGWLHLSLGYSNRWFKWGVISSIFFIGSVIIGLQWGATGVASALSICYYFLVLPSIKYAGAPIGFKVSKIIPSIITSLICALFSLLIMSSLIYFEPISFLYGSFNPFPKIICSGIFSISLYIVFALIIFKNNSPLIIIYNIVVDLNLFRINRVKFGLKNKNRKANI